MTCLAPAVIRVHRPALPEAGARSPEDRSRTARGFLAPAPAKNLRERWLATRYKGADEFVFVNRLGRPLDYRDVGEAFRKAVKKAGLTAPGKLTLHSLRHTFASLLIVNGLNVAFVSRQLGHANPSITLWVYTHLFQQADDAETARDALEASYAALAATSAS